MRSALMIILAVIALLAAPAAAQIAVRGETVWTMSAAGTAEPLRDGVVLVREGKIERVGSAASTPIPAGYRTVTAKVVTPGLIDAHTVVGLSGYLNQVHDQDQTERSTAIQPELRAIDAYNPKEELVGYLRSFGITTIHTGHGPGPLVSGQTMAIKTAGGAVDADVILSLSMVAATFGDAAREGAGKAPGTRAKMMALLRAELIKAKEAEAKAAASKDKPDEAARDLRLEMFRRLIRRETRLLVTVHRSFDIATVLRLGAEFNIGIVLDGASEAYLMLDQIKKSGYPVILHATMARAGGDMANLSKDTASKLKAAGIPFALQSGYESYVPKTRVVLFEAGVAAAFGLSYRDALASITIDAARILGLEKLIGSIEPGKDADLALYDGDPFEYTSHCTGVVINGVVASGTPR